MTGARRDNVMTMKWDDVQLERGEWRIPQTKGGTEHVVPLLPEAVTILKVRKDSRGEDEYVFPGAGTHGHLVEPKKGWRRILDRAELIQLVDWIAKAQAWPKPQSDAAKAAIDVSRALKEARATARALHIDVAPARIKDLRIHDLRRTLGSWQAATGANLSVIGRTLQHQNVSTTAIYARLNLDSVREAMQKATSAMLVAGGIGRPAEVNSEKEECNPFLRQAQT